MGFTWRWFCLYTALQVDEVEFSIVTHDPADFSLEWSYDDAAFRKQQCFRHPEVGGI